MAIPAPPPLVVDDGGRTIVAGRPGWFVCDGVDIPLVVLAGAPGRDGVAALTVLDKNSGVATTPRYAVGTADPGAGQVYRALRLGGRETGNVHLVNPGMIGPPGRATTPPVTSVTLGARAVQCRWRVDTVASGVTARRGVSITRENGALVYRTFDFARPSPMVAPDGVQRSNRPSLEIRGGIAAGGAWRFDNRGYGYVLRAGASEATLTVLRAGRVVQRERFLGITLAR